MNVAVRVTKELICDMCGVDGDIKRYRITRTGTKTSVQADLCPEHRELLEAVIGRKKRKGQRTRRVYTPEEIAAKKRTAKKAPRRRS